MNNMTKIKANVFIMEDYSEDQPKNYNGITYHTYAVVSNMCYENEDCSDNPVLEQDENIKNKLDMEMKVLKIFQDYLIENKIIQQTTSYIDIFDPVIAFEIDVDDPYWIHTREGQAASRWIMDKKFRLFFTNLPHDYVQYEIMPAFGGQTIIHKENDVIYEIKFLKWSWC